MKRTIEIGIFLVFIKIIVAQDDFGLYSRRYERLDIDAILSSPRLVTNYVDCLLNKKPCPPEGKALKRILPEALRTKCSKCWPNQKEGALKVITALYYDYPNHYKALREKWDQTGEYHRRFEEYLRDQSFNIIGSNNDINQGEQSQVTPVLVENPSNNRYPVAKKNTTNINTVIKPDVTPRPTRQDMTTIRTPTTRQNNWQQTTTNWRQQTSAPNPSQNDIINRFGNDEQQHPTVTPSRRQTGRMTTQPTTRIRTTTNIPEYLPGFTITTTFHTQNHILNLINRLALKFSNTADFLTGIVRAMQPPQRY